jgi:hypothetical protein
VGRYGRDELSGGDDEDDEGDHREQGEAMPGRPGAVLVVVETDLR